MPKTPTAFILTEHDGSLYSTPNAIPKPHLRALRSHPATRRKRYVQRTPVSTKQTAHVSAFLNFGHRNGYVHFDSDILDLLLGKPADDFRYKSPYNKNAPSNLICHKTVWTNFHSERDPLATFAAGIPPFLLCTLFAPRILATTDPDCATTPAESGLGSRGTARTSDNSCCYRHFACLSRLHAVSMSTFARCLRSCFSSAVSRSHVRLAAALEWVWFKATLRHFS